MLITRLHYFYVTYNIIIDFPKVYMTTNHFKHSELAETYHVSLKTVHNWISYAKAGKNDLKLQEVKGVTYVANTPENTATLKQLAQKGKKYRNTLHHKIIQPKPEFYEIYSRRQILDIITSLNVHNEIPRQYNYFQEGANNWDNWLKRLAQEKSNTLVGTIELIQANLNALMRIVEGYRKINIIDLGVGNAFPVKGLLAPLIEHGLLKRYIAIDVSASMLSIAEQNINKWYGDRVNFEGYVRDITTDQFDDLLVDDMLGNDAEETVNLVLLLGSTPTNFRFFDDAFRVARKSMGINDILVYTDKIDTEAARTYFDFNTKIPGSSIQPHTSKLSPSHNYILKLLNLDESMYDVEMGFDSIKRMRYIRIRLKTSATIKFDFDDTEHCVTFEKGEAILLLRIRHMTSVEIISEFEKSGFTLLHSSLTKNRQFFLSISGIEVNKQEP